MEGIYLDEVIGAVRGYCQDGGNIFLHDISTDSRKVKKGDLFIALIGENFDGHDFIHAAVEKGAAAVVASKPVTTEPGVPVILVADTGKALLDLAGFYRQKFQKPVIAVTGSVGKTSTKNMIASALSAKLQVHKTEANFNNDIGLPLTIFQFAEKHDVMVLEMGMRGFGEISILTRAARPTIAVITNIGISHLERLGSQENNLKAKMEIVEGLVENGVLILNGNDPLLSKVKPNYNGRIVYTGVNIKADYSAYDLVNRGEEGVDFKIRLNGKEYAFHIPAVGEHNVSNALFGIACGMELGLSPEELITGVGNYSPEKLRCDILEIDGIKFINDSYNASPDSMKAALNILANLAQGKRSVAVIGNIFELGEMAGPGHFQVGKMCRELNVDFTAIIGENAADVARGINDSKKYQIFDNHEDIAAYLKGYLKKGDVVLIKGSRGMRMEKVLELWQTQIFSQKSN
ncbi:MAG: UDP-N-acetylmuramoyl-tripeptide--D-alanyl-D-alanine ligase [Clostridia bacterium]|nr:UDP-N-acetylmuramoyl-tripeptide--D-alanyl-D-alanine ligase [Clostridia bacterium]